MITNHLKKTIATITLASVISTTSIYSRNLRLMVNATEITGELTVTAHNLWTYSKADWTARIKVVRKGDQFTIKEMITVEGRQMYRLANGLYITANPKYVKTNLETTKISAPEEKTPEKSSSSTKETKTTLANLNLRKDAGTSHPIITTMTKGSLVEVLDSKDGWSKVKYKENIGWASNKYLGNSQQSTKIETTLPATSSLKTTTHNLYMREGPSTSNPSMLIIPKGTVVECLSSSNGWDQVSYGGKTGYASSSYLKTGSSNLKADSSDSKPSPSQVVKPTLTLKYTTANLYMRQGPTTSQSSLLIIPKGSKVESLSSANGWDQVSYGGKTGYSSTKFLVETKQHTGEDLLNFGKQYVGVRYTWGGNNATEGFDCSGLTKNIFANFGYQIPRVSYQQAVYGKEVSLDQLQIGDVLYFGQTQVSHVAIYAGINTMLHASSHVGSVVIQDITSHITNYNIVGARRFLD